MSQATEVTRAAEAEKLLAGIVECAAGKRPPIYYMDRWRMYVGQLGYWDEAAEKDPQALKQLLLLAEKSPPYTNESKDFEGWFVGQCFQSPHHTRPALAAAMEAAMPVFMRLVYERHPQTVIWLREEKNATPETESFRDAWNLKVLEHLEDYIRYGEDIPRKELVAKRIFTVIRRRALDVLIVAYVRRKSELLKRIDAMEREMAEATKKKQERLITQGDLAQLATTRAAERRQLMAELHSYPSL